MIKHLEKALEINDIDEYVNISDDKAEGAFVKTDKLYNQAFYIKTFQNKDELFNNIIDIFKSDKLSSVANIATVEELDHTDSVIAVAFKAIKGEPLSNYTFIKQLTLSQTLYIVNQIAIFLKQTHQLSYFSHTLRPDHIYFDSVNNVVTIIPVLMRSDRYTNSRVIKNTEHTLYVSPEELEETDCVVDWRSDYYKLGLIFYELILKRKLLNTDEIRSLHNKDIEPVEIEEVDLIIKNALTRLTEFRAEKRFCTDNELRSTLAYINTCVDASRINCKNIYLHKINNSIYPRKLYNHAFDKITELYENNLSDIVISGYSGYGKSVFIENLEMKCHSLNFLFLKGVFYEQSISQPFAAIKQCLLSLAGFYSTENIVNSFKYLKNKVDKHAFSSVFSLCRDVFDISVFDDVVDEAMGSEGFYKGLIIFIEHLIDKRHVFLVMENIQWCDKENHELIMSILNNRSTYIHFIFSYRSNEVATNVYAAQLIEKCMQDNNVYFQSINGFSNIEFCDFSSNYLGLSLSDIYLNNINRRSQGNPFFLKQILISLYSKDLNADSLDELALKELSGEYMSLEYYIRENINNISEKHIQLLKYMACYGKPISEVLLSDISLMDLSDVSEVLQECIDIGCVLMLFDGFSFSNDKVKEVIYASIDIDEQRFIHKNISYSLQKNIGENNLFESVIQLNLAKSILNDSERLDAVKINVEAARYSLNQLSYNTSNSFYKYALDYVCSHEEELGEKFVESIHYGSVYTSFLSGDFSGLIDKIDKLLNQCKELADAAKYYALYKDIIVSTDEGYGSAATKGVELLSRFDFGLPSTDIKLKELKRKVESIDLVEISSHIFDGLDGGEYKSVDEEKYQIRILLDLWEAAYYSQNLDLMELSIYKILDVSIFGTLYSESSFGFVMYSMYLSEKGEHDQAYESGLLALKIIDKYDDKIMFPKITNLFCNYTAFYVESFSDISERYYSSYKSSVLTSDFLFGAWASYFFVWTKFLSGEKLSCVLDSSKDVFSFLNKTNDKKMLMSYFYLCDAVNVLSNNDLTFLKDEQKSCELSKDSYEYFSEIKFSPGIAWQAIVNLITNYIYGNYQVVIDVIDKRLVGMNIDIVMFPVTQIYFYESLSLLQLLKNHNHKEDQYLSILNKLEISAKSLSKLSRVGPLNYNVQFCIIKISFLLNDIDLFEINEDLDQMVKHVINEGSYLEKGILFEILAQDACLKHEYLMAREYVLRSVDEYGEWGADLKVKQLSHDYAAVLVSDGVGRFESKDKNKWTGEFSRLLKASVAVSGALSSESVIRTTVESAYSESSADKIYFVSCLNHGFEIACSCIGGVLNSDLNHDVEQGSNVILDDLVHYCFGTQTSVYLDSDESFSPFMKEDYVINNSIKSIICVPVIYRQRVLAILYLENSRKNIPLSLELFDFIKMMLVQVSVSLVNSYLYVSLKDNVEKQTLSTKELSQKVDKMNYIHSYSSLGVWDWDISTGDLEWSDEIYNIFGCSRLDTEINFDNFILFIHPDDREIVKTAIQACFDGFDYSVEHRVIRPDGAICWVLEKGYVLRDLDKKPLKMFGIVQDITHTKEIDIKNIELNRQLDQSRKMETIGHLTGGIAHDFNNILASMLGYTELAKLMVSSSGDEKLNEYLDNVYLAGQRAKDLVAQMMLFSRAHATHDEPVALAPLVKESVKMLKSTIPSSIKITSLIPNNLPDVVIDPIQAQQILINLCVNSRDAIQDIGKIKITLQSGYVSSECDSCHEKFSGDFVSLTIEDNGSGIEEDVMDKIFDPFFTTKEVGKGTGMGMSVVHGIVHSHHGHVLISSSHSGTRMTILLPVSEQEKNMESPDLGQDTSSSELNKTIVVVDDELLILEFIRDLLSLHGARVVTFSRSIDALDYILKNINEVDLMITDMTMPEMNGTTLSKKIFEVKPDFPIILCTGQSLEMDEKKAGDIGIKGYLTKPYSANKFINKIDEILA
ncbi:MAG: hypothetical protein DIZ80_02305 [endosymbiont of Galathealinum brachiosum]|uniref:histidine kinase n=1 Tax=endosymbiont of Galathealinum brachiosum TaxID=2200906 RepID=A0A370DK41_9GAMM|nr:MAG: hypothetical protein DIZ80_02305 [endosymbiont of Galathealinum brachiosum]